MAKSKLPKRIFRRSPSMPIHTDAAMDRAGMGGKAGKKTKKRRPFPPPPSTVPSGGTGPGMSGMGM